MIPNIDNPKPMDIHIGDSTQIQVQLIIPISFRVINTTVNNPINPIPEDEDEEDTYCLILAILFLLFYLLPIWALFLHNILLLI